MATDQPQGRKAPAWSKADALKRRKLQGWVFPQVVHFDREKKAYRTTWVNSFFGLAGEIPQKMALKEKGKGDLLNHFSLLVARRGIEPLLPE
jgi:hypothetical protein